jgi:SAM-dependent methyltransferase
MSDKYGPEYYAARRMSAGREEHVPRTLAKVKRVVKLAPGMRVLEVGCGLGGLTRALAAEVAHVTGIDISAHAIAQARPAANAVFEEADALSYRPAGKFDLVLALAVFEHFGPKEREKFLRRARGWLAPGGHLVLHVPIAESWSAKRRRSRRQVDQGIDGPDYTGDPTHKATFSVRTFRAAVREGGFRITKEWIRTSRLGWPTGWANVAMSALPARVRETFAMEAVLAAEPEDAK